MFNLPIKVFFISIMLFLPINIKCSCNWITYFSLFTGWTFIIPNMIASISVKNANEVEKNTWKMTLLPIIGISSIKPSRTKTAAMTANIKSIVIAIV